MRAWVFGAVVALAGTGVWADGSAISSVISQQIEAFKVDDFETAFTFASPGIQGIFGTPENFGRMVAQGYPMVWRPSDVDFGALSQVGDGFRQIVLVLDAQGRPYTLAYDMIETDAGWKIAGVQLLRSDPYSA